MCRCGYRQALTGLLIVFLGVAWANDTVLLEASGTGDAVIRSSPTGPALARMSHAGEANFIVIAYDAQGEQELLVNAIGSYDGTRPVGFTGNTPTEFTVNADGAWTFSLLSLAAAPAPAGQGLGDAVLRVGTSGSPSRVASFAHDGAANFVVIAWGSQWNLLVNHIGAYQGTVRIPPGTVFVEIVADGGWTMGME